MKFENNLPNSQEKTRRFLQDYANDFWALGLIFDGRGIEGVRDLFRGGFKIATVQEFIENIRKNNKETINNEEEKDPMFLEKSKKINELANKINSLGEKAEEEEVRSILEEVKKIIY